MLQIAAECVLVALRRRLHGCLDRGLRHDAGDDGFVAVVGAFQLDGAVAVLQQVSRQPSGTAIVVVTVAGGAAIAWSPKMSSAAISTAPRPRISSKPIPISRSASLLAVSSDAREEMCA